MKIHEDGRLLLVGLEGQLAELAYLSGLADAYSSYAKRTERILKGMIKLKEEEENGKKK